MDFAMCILIERIVTCVQCHPNGLICSEQVDENEPERNVTGPSEAFSLDHDCMEAMEPAPQASENDETTAEDKNEIAESNQARKGEIIFSTGRDMKVALIPVSDIGNIAEKEDEHKE